MKKFNDSFPLLAGSAVLGNGINICGPFDGTFLSAIYSMSPGTGIQQLGSVTYSVPANAGYIPFLKNFGTAETYATREEYNSHFSASADASTSFLGFSLNVEASFTQDIDDTNSSSFGTFSLNAHTYDLNLINTGVSALDESLTTSPDYLNLPDSYTPINKPLFFAFFNQFGTHFISTVRLGGSLIYSTAVKSGTTYSNTDTSLEVSAEYKGVLSDTSAEAQQDFQVANSTWFDSTVRKIYAQGGSVDILASVTPEYDVNNNQAFMGWLSSMDDGQVALIDFVVSSIDKIFTGNQAAAVRSALKDYTNYYIQSELAISTGNIKVAGTDIAPEVFAVPIGEFGRYQLAVLDEVSLDTLVAYSCSITSDNINSNLFSDVLQLATPYQQSNHIIIFSLISTVPPIDLEDPNLLFFQFLVDNCGAGSNPGDPLSKLQTDFPMPQNSPYLGNYGIISTFGNPDSSTEVFSCMSNQPSVINAFLNPQFNDPSVQTPTYTLTTMGLKP